MNPFPIYTTLGISSTVAPDVFYIDGVLKGLLAQLSVSLVGPIFIKRCFKFLACIDYGPVLSTLTVYHIEMSPSSMWPPLNFSPTPPYR
jgi:hypothetical protein